MNYPAFIRSSRVRTGVAGAATLALLGVTTSSVVSHGGSSGVGDPYYPDYGNGGYDVGHYALDVKYVPGTDQLSGTATITARATEDLSRFNLDFGLPTSTVLVNGTKAKVTRTDDHELTVTPRKKVRAGSTMAVRVTYSGVPSETTIHGNDAWIQTDDGAIAMGQPEIAAWWFPSSDHPRDKATYEVTLRVPQGVEAISNGRLVSQRTDQRTDTWKWRQDKPMAPYLAFMAVGQFDVSSGTTPDGKYWLNAIASGGGAEGRQAKADLARTPEVVAWAARHWGPYPYDEMGAVAVRSDQSFALENQTRPTYSRDFWAEGSNLYPIVHEQAHQCFGNSVSLANWKDIWLNESYATYTEWLWSESQGQGTAKELLAAYYDARPASDRFWKVPVGDPGRGREFHIAVYERGAMSLHALRQRIGDEAFFRLSRSWAAARQHGNGNVAEFIAMAQEESGQDLEGFFRNWLHERRRPAPTAENGLQGVLPAPGATVPVPKSKPIMDDFHGEDEEHH